jgi:hypothetical protein
MVLMKMVLIAIRMPEWRRLVSPLAMRMLRVATQGMVTWQVLQDIRVEAGASRAGAMFPGDVYGWTADKQGSDAEFSGLG